MRRTKTAIIGVTALLLASLASATPALAETPWWSLSSSVRPTFITAGSGKPGKPGVPGEPEVQEITVALEEHEGEKEQGALVMHVGTALAEEFYTEPFAGDLGVAVLDAAGVQHELEKPYGAGKVKVTEKTEGGVLKLVVESPLGSTPIEVSKNGIGTPSVAITSPGTAEVPPVPPTPDGEIVVTAENLGDAAITGSKTPVTLSDILPKGFKAVAIDATKPSPEADFLKRTMLTTCSLTTVSCTLNNEPGEDVGGVQHDALAPFDRLEMRIGVDVEPGVEPAKLENEVTISGGEGFTCRATPGKGSYKDSGCVEKSAGANFERTTTGPVAPASIRKPITLGPEPVQFGVEDYELLNEEEGGTPTIQAGAHPFQQTTTITLNQTADSSPAGFPRGESHVNPAGLPKDIHFNWPAGLIGNPSSVAQCTDVQFFAVFASAVANRCPAQSAVGVATVLINEPSAAGVAEITVPLFNLVPRRGEPARLGFNVTMGNAPVTIDTSLRSGGDYGVTVQVNNITQTAAFISSQVTVWGVPGDPRHARQRGWGCLLESRGFSLESLGLASCASSDEQNPPPFLSLATSCGGQPKSTVTGDTWADPLPTAAFPKLAEYNLPAQVGCNRLPFSSEIKVTPDGTEASKPTGLNVDVHVPQEEDLNSAGLASAAVRDITVKFPEGVVVNPASADGLQACSQELVGLQSGTGANGELLFTPTLPEPLQQGTNFCPDASKIATVTIKSPLLPKGQFVEGAMYLATPAPSGEPGKNPFNSLVAAYIVATDPISGTVVKLPGVVELNGTTGQITSRFENSPQLAFEDAEIHLLGGERAPLATPSHCGTYKTEAEFTPWSGTAPIKSSSSFQITSGPDGGPCPPAALPFNPTLTAGSPNVSAGSFSPLTTTISRDDGNQNINKVQLHFAPGMSGILAGIPLCHEAEANAGTCPESSLIGSTIVSVGLGGDPFTVTGGKVYLTEKYEGAPFGLSIVNPAVAGPFDLGKVTVRAKIEVDPSTAALTVTTGEIPHILDGIPLQIKHINVSIDRQGFTFNPTNCNPLGITGAIGAVEGASSPVSDPFQVTNCAALKFTPKFNISTSGKTSKAQGASLIAKLSEPNESQGSQANIALVKVELPKQLPSRLTTLQKACTNAQFELNPANCPPESKIGFAKVTTPLLPVPLEGPAIFVSHGGEAFPSLTMVLQGYGVTVDLVGTTFISKAGITSTTFKTVPDVPFNTFTLTLPQGKFSALAANGDLCASKLTMPSEFVGQNGAKINQNTPVSVTGCAKKKALTRAQKLKAALKVCKKKAKGKRVQCEKTARRQYGPIKAKRKPKK
jgi:hypothetical protein